MPNELVHLRVGPWIVHPDAMILPFAGLFFAVLTYRALCVGVENSRRHALLFVILCFVGGVVGARVYGAVGSFCVNMPILSDGAWKELRFGSVGGIWGILFVVAGYRMVQGKRALRYADAVIPGICVGGSVARISCLFQGCCPGKASEALPTFVNPVYAWPALDIGALLLTLSLVLAMAHISKPVLSAGHQAVVFLCTYGLLRFLIEFARATFTVWGPFTWGQTLSLAMLLAGFIGLGLVSQWRSASFGSAGLAFLYKRVARCRILAMARGLV